MPADLLLIAAAEAAHEGESHLPFYLLGSVLALWAIVVAVLGIRRPSFPATTQQRNLVMLVTTVLVIGACGSAALTG